MGVKLVSSGGGSVEINPPATAVSYTATMPAGTGTVAVNGVNGTIVSGTAVIASSTSVDFTGIPSWVKRITVMFFGVSISGTSNIQFQLGSGSPTTTGYLGSSVASTAAGNSAATSTTGFVLLTGAASYLLNGIGVFTNLSGNSWAGSVSMGQSDIARSSSVSAAITIGGTLDRIRITTVNGTDTFDAGSINILYE
jgi:hypothetical protein